MQKVLKGRRTKRKLAAALKALLEGKPLDRVRVHELTDRCDIHRQTFYYHFEDVYALLAWCAEEDGGALAAELDRAASWQEALERVLEFLGRDRGYSLALLEHPAVWRSFCGRILPLASRWDPRFSGVLEPLIEKWVREGDPPEKLIALLEALTV